MVIDMGLNLFLEVLVATRILLFELFVFNLLFDFDLPDRKVVELLVPAYEGIIRWLPCYVACRLPFGLLDSLC